MTTNHSQQECVDCKKAKVAAEEKQYAQQEDKTGGAKCQLLYLDVDRCMKNNKGQIAPCQKQWSEFRKCHDASKSRSQ